MTSPQVRPATVADADALGRVHVRTWQVAYRGQFPGEYLDALNAAARAAHWKEVLARGEMAVFVSEQDGSVVGFCGVRPSTDPDLSDAGVGEYTALYVDAAHWRGGHGTALVRAAREAAERAGWKQLALWVLVSNSVARAFYERHGYVADGSERTTDQRGFPMHQMRYRLDLTGS